MRIGHIDAHEKVFLIAEEGKSHEGDAVKSQTIAHTRTARRSAEARHGLLEGFILREYDIDWGDQGRNCSEN